MLKIKESVDLKELEKFGFSVFNDNKQALYEAKNKYCDTCWFYVYKNNKIIGLETKGDFEDLDILYDLIKADMIEKIEE